MPNNPSDRESAAAPRAARPLSGKDAVKEAKRRHEAAVSALRGAGPAPLPLLPLEMIDRIDRYKPQGSGFGAGVWAQIGPLCRLLTRYYAPDSDAARVNVMWHLSRYLRWVARQPHRTDLTAPLRLDELDTPGLQERHRETADEPGATMDSRRSIVTRALLHAKGGRRPATTYERTTAVPHTGLEIGLLVKYAHQQSTPTGRRSMCFIVGLSAGSGLDAHDLSLVRRRHLRTRPTPNGGDVLTVLVVDTDGERLVVVADVMRSTVELAMEMHDQAGRGEDAFILGTPTGRDGVVQNYIEKARTADPRIRPPVSCRRMRNTWLLAALDARIPVPELLAAAGLKYATTLLRLMPYSTPLDKDYVNELFASMDLKWRRFP